MHPVIWSRMRTQFTVLLVRQSYETFWCQIKQLTFFTPNSLSITRFRISSTFLLEAAIVVSSSSSSSLPSSLSSPPPSSSPLAGGRPRLSSLPPPAGQKCYYSQIVFALLEIITQFWQFFTFLLTQQTEILFHSPLSFIFPTEHWDTFPSPDHRSHDHSVTPYFLQHAL